MSAPILLSELLSLQCAECGGEGHTHDGSSRPLDLDAQCHRDAGVRVTLDTSARVLALRCAECDADVVSIQL